MTERAKGKLEILHVIGAFCAGGAERFVGDLSVALSQNGMAVGVIALSERLDPVGYQMKEQMELAGVLCDRGPTNLVRLRSLLWYIAKLRDWRPQIVHLHTENTELAHFLAGPWLNARPDVVRTIHTTNRSPNRFHRLAIRGNPAIVSIACGEAVARQCRAETMGVLASISNGIRFDWPVQTNKIKRRLQQELCLESREFHFLHVGNLKGATTNTAPKAHDVLIESWRLARLGEQGGRLHLVGDGNLRASLEQLAAGDDTIVFHGVRADVKKWLLAADCFVMPSRYEGLPIAAIEAVGTGLPCIFSDIDPLMGFSGPSVLRVATDDALDLAQKLTIARHHTPVMETSEAQRGREHYGIEKTATKYAELYGPLLLKTHAERYGPTAR